MLAVSEWFRKAWPIGLALIFWACMLAAEMGGDRSGYVRAKAEGDKALSDQLAEQAGLREAAAQEALVLYRQQVARVSEAESLMLSAQDNLAAAQKKLQERIPNVTTVYVPTRGAAPVSIPRAVFTCGWLRDYNAALGASVPVPAACTAYAGSKEKAWPAAGSDAELLASGVTPADILAHVQDYGLWAQSNLVQLNELIDLFESKEVKP